MTETPSALEHRAREAAARFVAGEAPPELSPLGDGLINDTFLVQPQGAPKLVLQRINRAVFPDPPAILHNLRTIENHLQRGASAAQNGGTALALPQLIPTLAGEDYLLDAAGDYWRALEYLEGTLTLEALDGPERAERVGLGLAQFHQLLSSLDPAQLQDTLPGFHVTSLYLEAFRETIAGLELKRARELRLWETFVEDRAERALLLERALHEGRTRLRVVHGDPKLSNFLFWRGGKRVVSLIDLDTVKPGLIHHDLGDCLRSCCNPAGELPAFSTSVFFDLDMATAILRGYLGEARELLSAEEVALIGLAIWLLPFELGVRFLTDHLRGNLYFKATDPQQNLHRAVTQFRLTESIEGMAPQIERVILELTGAMG